MIFKWQEQAWKTWVQLRERLPHAILIQSGEGMGEFEFAQACAQSLLCEKPGPDRQACGSCRACSWFSHGNHPDFRLIVPESMAPESREEGAERLLATVRSRCLRFTLPLPDPAQVLRWLKEQGVERPETALAAAGGAPLGALKAVEMEADRLGFIEGLQNPRFDPIALAESVVRVPLWDLVGWLQRWSYDLLLARLAGRIRYNLDREAVIAATAARCDAAELAGYLRRLAAARALARHPLNARLFAEDLLLGYQRLISA